MFVKRLICADGVEITTRVYTPETPCGSMGLIIAPALGVPQGFYGEMARFFQDRGIGVLTLDYRGTGGARTSDTDQFRLEEWGRYDMDAAIRYARTQWDRVFLLGHSVGGQLCPLAPAGEELDGMILVGASFPHWRGWGFPRNLYMAFFWHGMLPLLALGRRYFPTRMLGLSRENMPVGFIRQWGQWARQKAYVTCPDLGIDTAGFQSFSAPVLSFGFDDDTYAPEANIERLHRALPRADVLFRFLKGRRFHAKGMGHFGFFRADRARGLWQETSAWMHKIAAQDSPQ